MAVKRKRTKQSIFSNKKRKGSDFSKAFFGTLGDPLGTIISLIRKQPPSWARSSRYKPRMLPMMRQAELIRDQIRGGRSMPYFPDAIVPANIRYAKSPFNTSFGMPIGRSRIFHNRGGTLFDLISQISTNPTLQNYGKDALIAAGTSLIPRAINWISNRVNRRRVNKYVPH